MLNSTSNEVTPLSHSVSQRQYDQFARILAPHQSPTFSFLGNTITCKFNCDRQGGIIYEFWGTAESGVPPLHSHPWDEAFYFLEGEVDFQVNDQVVQATPGYFINLPAGVAHTFRVTSPQAKFLVLVSSTAAERYLIDLAQASQQRSLTPEEVMAIAEKHHIRRAI